MTARTRPRIYHGPANVGDIGHTLAAWQNENGADADFIVYEDASPSRHDHPNLRLDAYASRMKKALIMLAFFVRCLTRYDIFHFYYGRSLLPLNLDLPVLRLFGKKLVMTFCGSDVRRHEVEALRNPWQRLIETGPEGPGQDGRKRLMLRWQGLWIQRFTAVRNTYANVKDILPAERIVREPWLNNVNLDVYRSVREYEPGDVPVIVHAPTNPEVKGTRYVERAVENLRLAGRTFRYLRLENIPRGEVRRVLREEADIVVDQLLVGAFGTLSCEAMLYGKPVCCHIVPDILERYPDCPIVPADVDSLEETLARLLDDPQERVALGRAGQRFVAGHCDPEAINRGVWAMYAQLAPPLFTHEDAS